jgi:hypothetical protein
MAKLTEIRLTLAAFIYSIELDLKQIINEYISSNFSDLSFLGDSSFVDRIKSRFLKEYVGLDPDNNIIQLVDFVDFQDTYTIIFKNKQYVPEHIIQELKNITAKLDLIVPIRNRVMHTRPLQVGDFTEIYAFVNEITESSKIKWQTTIETKEK